MRLLEKKNFVPTLLGIHVWGRERKGTPPLEMKDTPLQSAPDTTMEFPAQVSVHKKNPALTVSSPGRPSRGRAHRQTLALNQRGKHREKQNQYQSELARALQLTVP